MLVVRVLSPGEVYLVQLEGSLQLHCLISVYNLINNISKRVITIPCKAVIIPQMHVQLEPEEDNHVMFYSN